MQPFHRVDSTRVRLDVVVEMKERRAKKALAVLGSAQRQAEVARSQAELAQRRLLVDERGADAAAMWAIADVASLRARTEAQAAERRAQEAEGAAQQARDVASHAKKEQQAMERAAEAQRQRIREERQRRDRRANDEVATFLFHQR